MVETAQTRQQELAEEVQLALAYARPADRPLFRSMFELDRRLAGVVATSSETVIGQMRLAWWRDLLCKPASERPLGEPLVTSISDAWGEEAEALTELVDGWEALLVAEALDPEALDQFCKGRASAWSAAVRGLGFAEAEQDNARLAGYRWALADLAAHLSDEHERSLVRSHADTIPAPQAMHRRARPLAILSGLAKRSLVLGGTPLLEGRGAALLALRIGISGR